MNKLKAKKLIIKTGDNYLKLVWAVRTPKGLISAYWSDCNPLKQYYGFKGLHLTCPTDGNFHYTYCDPANQKCIRKFYGRFQILDHPGHKPISDSIPIVPGSEENLIIPMSPGTPLADIEVVAFPLGTWGMQLPLDHQRYSRYFSTDLTESEKAAAFNLDDCPRGTLNIELIA